MKFENAMWMDGRKDGWMKLIDQQLSDRKIAGQTDR